jgi:Fe-S oxidoreductase
LSESSLRDSINLEIRECLLEMGAQGFYKCYQCGKCSSVCPWFQVGTYDFPVCRFPLEAAMGMIASSEEKDEIAREVDKIYRCVGCEACVDQCPHGVHIPNILRAGRRLLVDFGSYPESLKPIVRKIHDSGNPLGEPREKRTAWTEGLDVPRFEAGMDFLYISCCLSAYDPRLRHVAEAVVTVLKAADVSFGILEGRESCCGEAVRRVGAENVFSQVAQANIAALTEAGASKVLVNSPHCYATFKNEYPELGATFEPVHVVQLLGELLEEGRLNPSKPFDKRVVYHDPCTLGRQNGIYEEPRRVLESIPGLELIEVPDFNRNLSMCCGAGSGGLWMEWEKDERMADIRLGQLLETGADVIAVACPYCQQMFEGSLVSMNREVPVLDITEILAQSL